MFSGVAVEWSEPDPADSYRSADHRADATDTEPGTNTAPAEWPAGKGDNQ